MTDIPEGENSGARNFVVPEELEGQRFDKALTELCKDLSRARVQALIQGRQVLINGRACTKMSLKLEVGQKIALTIPPPEPAEPEAENIPLDIVFEDEHLLVINKQAGLVVHPGAGNWTGTLVNALLYHCGDELSGIGGVVRPGIVHRLDKETSGLMLVAKNDFAHNHLSGQLSDRSLTRIYHALCLGIPMPPAGTINQAISRDTRNRMKMSITHPKAVGKEAVTQYKTIHKYHDAISMIECALKTGRTHQIRVHMAFLKHNLIGDPLYGAQRTAVNARLKKSSLEPERIAQILDFPRQALHAKMLSFIHPVTEERMQFTSDYPCDFLSVLNLLNN